MHQCARSAQNRVSCKRAVGQAATVSASELSSRGLGLDLGNHSSLYQK